MSEAPRRSKRSMPTAEPDVLPAQEPADLDEDGADEDEEITRCLCGQQEYPGPPLSEAFDMADAQSEDAGGLFIQCDGCSVWQHGGCVGIVDESQSPDKYYCEDCRPKQHEVHTDTRGQRYSLYLPVAAKLARGRKGSISSKSDERANKARSEISRGSIDPASGKRRGTIRSREHDEEAEQIQRAIEESTRDAQTPGGKRNGKRGRDDSSEEVKQEIKRQRRVSEAYPTVSRHETLDDDSDDDGENGTSTSRSKKARAEAVQTQRAAEQREKDKERERVRAAAAGRRQERAGRRRADDPDPSDDTPTRASPPPSSQPESPPPSTSVPPEKISHKKGAGGKRVKRLGNNQYTKHRGEAIGTASPHSKKRLLAHAGSVNSSGDEAPPTNGEAVNSTSTPAAAEVPHTNGHGNGTGKGKWGKGKKNAYVPATTTNGSGTVAERALTMPGMNRTLEGMMGFIQRAQLEAASDRARLLGSGDTTPEGVGTAMEMAERLTRGIREWQERFGPAATA